MKSITLAIITAALVSACAITPDQGSTMQLQLSPQAVPTATSSSDTRQPVPASSRSDVRQEATPNIDLQIYYNPDLQLAVLELRTIS